MLSALGTRAPSPSDAELLARLGARETSALDGALRIATRDYALGVAHRVLRDRAEAEEVVQDVFLQLWNARGCATTSDAASFSSWLFVMARNRALDRLRQRGSRPRGDPRGRTRERAGEPERRDRSSSTASAGAAVPSALAQLPAGQREAIELSFYRGLSHSEIARETGEPLGTVKSRMSRAMAALREALEGAA